MDFVGRARELGYIRSSLLGDSGVTTIETVGLGGVGKTQTAIEYCYRHYQPSSVEEGKFKLTLLS